MPTFGRRPPCACACALTGRAPNAIADFASLSAAIGESGRGADEKGLVGERDADPNTKLEGAGASSAGARAAWPKWKLMAGFASGVSTLSCAFCSSEEIVDSKKYYKIYLIFILLKNINSNKGTLNRLGSTGLLKANAKGTYDGFSNHTF
jgi:hypothetical protein